jgi:putative ABC transport system permease protein
VAYWRSDFASLSLGRLLNRLAVEPSGVLVSRSLVQQYGLVEGDTLELTIYSAGEPRKLAFTIVGVFDIFPTWIPSEESQILLVANLENIYEQAGMQLPYSVWLRTDHRLDQAALSQTAAEVGLAYTGLQDAPARIATEQQRPERQGLFGVLSVGFSAGALLTVLGFLLYALFSFRSRFIELGVLRAVGLSAGQMIFFLAWELAFLLLVGSAAGTVLGVWASKLFIPYMQISSAAAAQYLPYQVIIAWPEIFRIYALFGLLFVVALSALGALLLRMKIFQAVKLGETI